MKLTSQHVFTQRTYAGPDVFRDVEVHLCEDKFYCSHSTSLDFVELTHDQAYRAAKDAVHRSSNSCELIIVDHYYFYLLARGYTVWYR